VMYSVSEPPEHCSEECMHPSHVHEQKGPTKLVCDERGERTEYHAVADGQLMCGCVGVWVCGCVEGKQLGLINKD